MITTGITNIIIGTEIATKIAPTTIGTMTTGTITATVTGMGSGVIGLTGITTTHLFQLLPA
jgi:hypothetical protein